MRQVHPQVFGGELVDIAPVRAAEDIYWHAMRSLKWLQGTAVFPPMNLSATVDESLIGGLTVRNGDTSLLRRALHLVVTDRNGGVVFEAVAGEVSVGRDGAVCDPPPLCLRPPVSLYVSHSSKETAPRGPP